MKTLKDLEWVEPNTQEKYGNNKLICYSEDLRESIKEDIKNGDTFKPFYFKEKFNL